MSDCAVRVVGLRRDFGTVRALDGLDLEIPAGSIFLLLGPNGAGKTTLLRILMGLIEPTAGSVDLECDDSSPHSKIAYVGDRCEPPNWATLAQLEELQAGAAPDFNKMLFRDLCRRRELPLDRTYGALSKGQRRWLLVALALACRPKLILLDEPADGLDPSARRALYDALRDHVNQCNATAIVTTHVIADVERIGDEVAIIDCGRLFLRGTLEDLRDRVRQVEIGGGETLPYLGDGVSILGHKQQGATAVFWITQDGLDDEELCRRLGPKASVHHVGLEELYFAIAEHRTTDETT
jgi:ABC-2 type transport system ATP-binding protein